MATNPLHRELLGVHEMIRADLARVMTLADDAAGGAVPEEIQERLGELKSSSILWQLKLGCLRHCRFVHSHHSLEDARLFPAIRRLGPELDPVVDRLEADHRSVSVLLATVEGAAVELDGEETAEDARRRVVESLGALGGLLLDHLAFEEEALEEPLGRMGSWPA